MIYNFDLYSVLLAIATNIPVWLKTGFVVIQGHIFIKNSLKNIFYKKQQQKTTEWAKVEARFLLPTLLTKRLSNTGPTCHCLGHNKCCFCHDLHCRSKMCGQYDFCF